MATDRRQAKRFHLSGSVTYEASVHFSSPNQQEGTKPAIAHAQIRNISSSGLCVLMNEGLQNDQIVKLGFLLPVVESAIPTIVEVRWVRSEPEKASYQAGMRFLL